MLDNRDRQMRSIIHQPRNIILGHFGKLFLENAFQPREDHKAVARPVVIDHPEFNISSTLLENCRLYKSDYQSHIPQDHPLSGEAYFFRKGNNSEGGLPGLVFLFHLDTTTPLEVDILHISNSPQTDTRIPLDPLASQCAPFCSAVANPGK